MFLFRLLNSKSTLFLFIIAFLFTCVSYQVKAKQVLPGNDQVYYELKIYHLKDSTQLPRIAEFLKTDLVPAYHKAGKKTVGLFYEQDAKLGTNVYVFTELKNLEDISSLNRSLSSNQSYKQAFSKFNTHAKGELLYDRIETVILSAFPMMNYVQVPSIPGNKANRVYELRSYESADEALSLNKIQMFNQGGEVPLFKRLDFNAVFYARVIAGAHMPNLMYMTVFANPEARDAHWKAFSADSFWKELVAKPEYQGNVSKNDDRFLKALPGSDI